MSEFNRPGGFGNGHRDDPEEQYRAGYQHGAAALFEQIQSGNPPGWDAIQKWIEIDLQLWRNKRCADPEPPKLIQGG